MDTVAVYFEKPVRTYGLKAQEGYTLVRLECDTDYLAELTNHLAGLQPPLTLLLFDVIWKQDLASLEVCLPSDEAPRLEEAVRATGGQTQSSEEVGVVNLQGPHFGDRWGIAKEALAALQENGVEPKALLGVTHTLQLLLDPSTIERALAGLRHRFSSPGASHA